MRPARLPLLALLVAAPARPDATELEVLLLLHSRVTSVGNEPRAEVRFDPGALAFDVARYLRPTRSSSWLSGVLAGSLAARSGPWRFELSADSAEIRRAAFPAAVEVCPSLLEPTGLALAGSAACRVPLPGLPAGPFLVPDLADDPAQLLLGGRSPEEEARATWFLREAWVGLHAGRAGFAFLRAGRHRFTVGEGFVYDDYGLGLEARLDLGALGPAWDLGLSIFWPTRDWPTGAELRSAMVVVRADYLPSLFDHVGAFAAFAHDAAGDVPALLRGALIESPAVRLQGLRPSLPPPAPTDYQRESALLAEALSEPSLGTADLLWLGASGSLRPWRRQRLSFVGALSLGRFRATSPAAVAGELLGTLASAAWEVRVHRDLLLEARFLWMSGDVPPAEPARQGLPERYGGFVGLAPWVTATNLFFRGGLSETFAARQASAAGVNGRGVYGPILRARWDPLPGLRGEVKGAFLVAPEVGPYGGRVYGPEVDLNLRWEPFPWLALSGEADALWPGSFYGGGATVTKVIAGIDLLYP